MKRDWLYILSPCIIAAIFTIVGMITALFALGPSGGWSFLAVIIGLPFLLTIVVADIILKYFITKKTGLIWLIEIIIVGIGIFILKSYMG